MFFKEPLHCVFFSASLAGYRIQGEGTSRYVQYEIICTCQLGERSKFYVSAAPFEWRIWKRYKEFRNLWYELKALKPKDFSTEEPSSLDVDPTVTLKRIRTHAFPPKHDITFRNRFGSAFIKERLYDLKEWFQLMRKNDSLFDFDNHTTSSSPIRSFLDVDYTLYLRKNDEWYAKDRRSLWIYDDRNTMEREQEETNGDGNNDRDNAKEVNAGCNIS